VKEGKIVDESRDPERRSVFAADPIAMAARQSAGCWYKVTSRTTAFKPRYRTALYGKDRATAGRPLGFVE
jgi:hypothetical protein